MKDKTITIKAYQAKCEFCGQPFVGLKLGIAVSTCSEHMYNDCTVLKCICIAKDIKYPIDQNKSKGVENERNTQQPYDAR